MRSNEPSAPFSACIDGISACREKSIRNKRKFPSETRPSLRITNKGSSKPEKETGTVKVSMNDLGCFHDPRSPNNSIDSHNVQFSHHQEHTASGSEVNLQRPGQLLCNYLHYVSDREIKAGIPFGQDQMCKYSDAQAGNWDTDTERQLEELLMKYLESICNGAVRKVASYGHGIEEAKKAVLRVGFSYRVGDALSNLAEKALLYLASTNLKSDNPELSDFKELYKFVLAEMVGALRDIRPSLKTGDALWCLIACDMNMTQASVMQGASFLPTDSSSSINHSTMSRSNGTCSPASVAALPCPKEIEYTHLSNITVNPSSEHQTSSLKGAIAQTTSILEDGIPQREKNGSESPVPSFNGRPESPSLACTERVGKEHYHVPIALKPNSASVANFRSAASLCPTCSECCREDTALSIGPPVRSAVQPRSPSKAATQFLSASASKERGKAFEEWTSPSTSSELVKPTIPLMVPSSSNGSAELSLQDCTCNTYSGGSCGTHHNQNLQLASGGAHTFSPNAAGEICQSDAGTSKPSKTSSFRTFSKSSHSNGVANVNGCSLSAAGKELSLAIASAMDCPKVDAPTAAGYESISHSIEHARDWDYGRLQDNKGLLLEDLMHRVKDLEKTLQERSKWAREKVTQAAKRLITDFSELKALRLEREEAARLKKEKQALEESSKKKVSDMETALRKTIGQVECANTAVRRLEIENAELRAEMEAAKLSASESAANNKAVAKREKQALKKEQTWERQRAKLQEEIAVEKRKIVQLQLELSQVKQECEAAEMRWRQEIKAKEAAINQVESERRAKEQVEAAAKEREDTLRRKVEADDRRHQDDIARLEEEIAHLSLRKDASKQTLLQLEPSLNKSSLHLQELRNIDLRMLQEVADFHSPLGRDLPRDRECVMCMSEERSVVFLPCAHQVICAECNSLHEAQGMKDCPSCRTFIEQRIRVYGANA